MSDADKAPSSNVRDAATRLAALWRQGLRPDPVEFLGTAGPLSPAQVAAVLRTDQWLRWEAGERPPAEAYRGMHAALAADGEEGFELIYGEFLLREERGESAEVDLARRFPRHAARLRQQVELHRAIAQRGAGETGSWQSAPEPGGAPERPRAAEG